MFAKTMRGPNGMTANSSTAGATKSDGRDVHDELVRAVGVSDSFCISLIVSAIGWSRPNGPTRFGP